MVMTGTTVTQILDNVELVSLDPEILPVPSCLRNLAPFPMAVRYASAAVLSPGNNIIMEQSEEPKKLVTFLLVHQFPDESPHVCSGEHHYYCRRYDPLIDNWSYGIRVESRIRYAHTTHPTYGLVISGGYEVVSSVIIVFDEETTAFVMLGVCSRIIYRNETSILRCALQG